VVLYSKINSGQILSNSQILFVPLKEKCSN